MSPMNLFTSLSFLLLIAIHQTNSWDYHSEGNDWGETCKVGLQAPIDISPPFLYRDISVAFSYSNMMTEYSLYHDGNNLQVDGDFGYVNYNKTLYASSTLLFFSPSQHTFKTNHFPLEMQIVHQDSEGNKLTLCVMFKKSKIEYSVLLGKLLFDDPALLKLQPNDKKKIREPINLSKYISTDKDFFIYDSLEPVPPCVKRNTFFILTDILNANVNQLSNFPSMIKSQRRVMQLRLNRSIWITIPEENIEEKIASDRRIRDDNERREMKNQELNQLQEQHSNQSLVNLTEENSPKASQPPAPKGGLEVSVPFESMKQKAMAREKISKKIDLQVISAPIDPPHKENMLIDKDMPRTVGEIKREKLRHKYYLWRSIYQDFIQGKLLSPIDSFSQMKQIEGELKKSNYTPFINDLHNLTNGTNGTSFIQLELPTEVNYQRSPSISLKGRSHPSLSMPPSDVNGRKALNENAELLVSANWPKKCHLAQFKSPINIGRMSLNDHLPLQLHLREPNGPLLLANDGYKLIISVKGDFGSIKHGDHLYSTQKMLIHVPSIHTLGKNEKRSAMEIEILSTDDFGNHAAIAILLDIGLQSNPFLKAIGFDSDLNPIYTSKLRNSEKIEIAYNKAAFKTELSLKQFIEQSEKLNYVSYIGTTTTPPCKSNVKWFVFLKKQSLSQHQLNHFPFLFGRKSNIRGLQPLNDRLLLNNIN